MLKTKLITAIFIFIFFVTSTSVLVAGLIARENKKNIGSASAVNSQEVAGVSQSVLTEVEVAKHSQPSDCWIIIAGNVYNVSLFLNDHPGGEGEILPYCGKDATNAFATKGNNPGTKHSQLATNMLTDYLVGKLSEVLGENFQNNNEIPVKSTSFPTRPTNPAILPVNQNIVNGVQLTAEEVAKHATRADCWMIIGGKVYNFTSYISAHPGGSVMVPYCGKDGTVGFQTQGGGGSHSSFASSLFVNYYLGDLGTAITTTQTNTNTGTTSNTINNILPTSTQANIQNLPQAILSKYPNAMYISGKYEDEGSWEGKINVSGQCRAIKVNANAEMAEDKSC